MTIEILTADIVAAYVSNNSVAVADVPSLIRSVHASLSTLGQPTVEPAPELKPAVPVKKSIQPDYLVCLDCGRKSKTLKRHIRVSHGLTPDEYRAKWGLSDDYPLVAPAYAKKRSDMALSLGLGKRKQA